MTKSPRKKTEVQRSSADFDEVLALIEAARRQAGRAVNVQLIDLVPYMFIVTTPPQSQKSTSTART
jgi:hypothetical protein